MVEVQQALAELQLGAPQAFRNLALFPLVAPGDSPAGYLLLDEALERTLARVTEVSREGSIPDLAFENDSVEKILLVDGDELVGAKQNRVINLSILVGGGVKIAIPVSCVEQGRWNYRSNEFRAAKRTLYARARAKKMASVSASMRERGNRRSDQGQVWTEVADKLRFLREDSPTGSMSDAYEASAGELEKYVSGFRAEPRQCGAVVAVDGKVVGLEVFDSAAVFAKYLERLVRGYAMDAIETANGKTLAPPEAEVRRFLDRVKSAAAERFAALGEGEDIRLSGEGIAGGALAAGGRVVHLAGYTVG
jgi:hypothetical protein